MLIPIKTNQQDLFKHYLSILDPFLKLRDKEADVLCAFLKVHYANRHNPQVNELLFSTEVLKALRESINMSESSFNNHKHKLRVKGLLTKDSISPILTKIYDEIKDNRLELTFRLDIINMEPKRAIQHTKHDSSSGVHEASKARVHGI